MNKDDQEFFANFDYLGLHSSLTKAAKTAAVQKERSLTTRISQLIALINQETTRVGKFIESRNLPDPQEAKMHEMQDAATTYGRRMTDS